LEIFLGSVVGFSGKIREFHAPPSAGKSGNIRLFSLEIFLGSVVWKFRSIKVPFLEICWEFIVRKFREGPEHNMKSAC
jgi:hypothetical protein